MMLVRNVIEFEELEAHFWDISDALENGDFEPVFRSDVRGELLGAVRDNFNSSTDAAGNAWPARKIVGDGHPLLIDRGDLMQAATGGGPGHVTEIDARSIAIGVDKEGGSARSLRGAAVHQFGYPPRNIPARPYLEADQEALDRIEEQIADFGLSLLGGV